MDFTSTRLPYRNTGAFSKIVLDYLDNDPAVQPFISHQPTMAGLESAIRGKQEHDVNRLLLTEELTKQYKGINIHEKVLSNMNALGDKQTFTITTAHQNNIFSGPLYFIYKILHAIKLSEEAAVAFPSYKFVPVFYVGSEDADLAELDHIHIGGEKLQWKTNQKGAVGRMIIDDSLISLINSIEGQVGVLPFGTEIISILKEHYVKGRTLQEATFSFINHLFGEYGLVVLLPDNARLKSAMLSIFEEDLFSQAPSEIVERTAAKLEKTGYKIQANPREINLFYLVDDKRERIELRSAGAVEKWHVLNTDISFTKKELQSELRAHPERFSPNVILRGLYQETILPNIAFIGGGGETAYWLQLKDLFIRYKTPLPVLILRNSFLVIDKKSKAKMDTLGIGYENIFLPEQDIFNKIVLQTTSNQTSLGASLNAVENLYDSFRKQAAAIDITLEKHVTALEKKTISRLHELEKKMLRAEKKKYSDKKRQVSALKQHLFPNGGLQERYENICYYYAKFGRAFISELYQNSLATGQEFVVLTEK